MQLSGRTLTCSWAAVALLFIACGEVKGTSTPDSGSNVDPDADFTLSVDPTSLSIPIAGSATVTVTVARTGTTGDIALSATGLGANLTAEFSPAAIPEGETSSEVTITVKGGTAAGTSAVTLTGTAGDKTHSADVSVTTTTITVTGTVRGNRAGVRVGIIGKQSQLSGAGGVFTFTDVTPPYDLYTFADNGCNTATPTVFYFDDLTRPDPIVSAGIFTPSCGPLIVKCGLISPCPNSNYSGTKSGVGNNTDEVIFAWSAGAANGTLNANGSYSGNISWTSGNSSSGNLHALQLTRKANGAPNAFLGYQRSGTVTLTSGQAATINLNFGTVGSTGTISGTLNGPAGFPTPTVYLWQEFGSARRTLWQKETTAIDAAFPLISLAGGNSLYATSTASGVGTSYYVQPLTGTATVNFTMPAAPMLTTPADAATGVTTTTMFAWNAPPEGVVTELELFTTSTQGTARAYFRIFTTKSEATIPVIPELSLPASQSFLWSVQVYAPASGIDDAAAASELEIVSSADTSGPAHAFAASVSRSFTTQ